MRRWRTVISERQEANLAQPLPQPWQFPSCGTGCGAEAGGQPQARRCWGGQPRKTTAAGVYRAPARRQLPRRRNLEIRRRSPRVQQSSDHYMYVKILLNARGKNSQTGLDKSIQCSQKAKNIACSYQSAWKKNQTFQDTGQNTHWHSASVVRNTQDSEQMLLQIHLTNQKTDLENSNYLSNIISSQRKAQ